MLKAQTCLATLWVSLVAFTGCASVPYLARPDIGQRTAYIKRVLVFPPHLQVYEVKPNGSRENKQEWSERASLNFTTALAAEMEKQQGAAFKTISINELSQSQRHELADTHGLLTAVNLNLLRHVYGAHPDRFVDINEQFDLSLGPDTSLLNIRGADAFLMINGVDHVSSSERLAVEVVRWSATAPLGLILDAPRFGQTWVSLALVDAPTGNILWYRIERSLGGYDVRNSEDAKAIMRTLLEDFPVR